MNRSTDILDAPSLIAAGSDHAKAKHASCETTASFPRESVMVHLSSFTDAMLAMIPGCLLFVSSTFATPLQLATASLLPASSIDSTSAPALTVSNGFKCFDPSFPPPGPLYRIQYSGCVDAADRMLTNVRGDVPLLFSRSEKADIQLPWRARSGNCMMTLNVLNEDEEDIMYIRNAYEVALTLCRMCVGGYYRYGGETPVGPREVVYISVYGTTPTAVEASGPAAPQLSHVVARHIEPRGPGLLNTSSLAAADISILDTSNVDEGECFSKSGPSPRKHLYPVKSIDCINAADEMMKNRRDHKSMTFGRRAGMDFKLPWRARNKSCIVTVDALNDVDFDTIVLWEVYQTALNRIEKCTTGENVFGGSKVVGSKNVVYVYVFGIGSPIQLSASALSPPSPILARAQNQNSELSLLNTSSSQTTEPLDLTSAATTDASPLLGIPECFDPPLPRERSVPVTNFTDCVAATIEIVGSRSRTQMYIFSRKSSTNPFHYQLPATFRTRTCVVHLDMENENAEDSVRLGYVESTAWVLAHKCSGSEKPEEKWGGTMTVSVGARDLIRVWVYGVLPPTTLLDEAPAIISSRVVA